MVGNELRSSVKAILALTSESSLRATIVHIFKAMAFNLILNRISDFSKVCRTGDNCG